MLLYFHQKARQSILPSQIISNHLYSDSLNLFINNNDALQVDANG